ncbi:MAG: tetratricopeptide repeat protein [Burkholderiales bacterium]
MSKSLNERMQAAFGRFQAQDFAGAERLCVEILRDTPRYPDAMHLLGVVRLATGNAGEAASLISGALEGKPRDPVVLEHLGLARVAQGDYAAAETAFREAIALGGQHGVLHMRLGMALAAQAKFAEALGPLREAAARAPDIPDVHLNLGNLLAAQGRTAEALACYDRVLAAQPDHTAVLFNLGNLYASMDRLDDAAAAFQRVLAIAPNDADARNNLGIVYQRQGKLDDAAASYRRALESNSRHAQAWHNLGTLHGAAGRVKDAVASYRKSLESDPGKAPVHNDLGTALRDSGDFEGAIAAYHRAISLDPQSVSALYNLAETLKVSGRFDEAIAAYERALAIKPDYFRALNGLTYLRQHVCDWDGIDALWERLRRDAFGKPGSGASPFSVLYMPTSAEEQLACSREWARETLSGWIAARPGLEIGIPPRAPRERLRIGYLSWDFHEHATSYLIAELFELHDRGRFEVYAYSYGPDDGSAIRVRIKSACDHFVDIAGDSHFEAARRIRGDGIDVLVDLKGYTLGSRPPIVALRPAPVQVNWLGFPGSMGTDCVDYIIADPFIVPAGTERHYTERVVRLPDCYQVNDRKRQISDRLSTRGENGLPAAGVVLCCLNQAAKILPDVFACWMRIMRAVPGSVLWLLESNRWAAGNLRRAAVAHGIAGDRLLFAPRRPLAEHLARYRAADLAIDTFPYTSHTTASDALWAGCPLVTRVGDTFVSRVAGSILRNAGMQELVTDNAADYERKVVELATAPGKLQDLRRRLRETRDQCPLFDTPRFVRNLESAYEDMLKALGDRGPMYNPRE